MVGTRHPSPFHAGPIPWVEPRATANHLGLVDHNKVIRLLETHWSRAATCEFDNLRETLHAGRGRPPGHNRNEVVREADRLGKRTTRIDPPQTQPVDVTLSRSTSTPDRPHEPDRSHDLNRDRTVKPTAVRTKMDFDVQQPYYSCW